MAPRYKTHEKIDEKSGKSVVSFVDDQRLTKREFGRRLYSAMMDKGWNQAELARQAGILPDSVSNYIRGRIMPSPKNLASLAQALGVKPEDLLPNYTEAAISDDEMPPLDMKVSAVDPTKAWLRINRLVRFQTAAKIIQLINEDDLADGA